MIITRIFALNKSQQTTFVANRSITYLILSKEADGCGLLAISYIKWSCTTARVFVTICTRV
ncbi:hypothetical protein PILCRDRAFT_819701 [Piloderma croceum F 1598]|uniref:Uncharacterized protein n=1 Tax=Piloderma croceum (strain F 1598) TaxID=765440 RepID=A0A0C3FYU4_PILCF|nr:hypothetical protein PILCRDRAFT_819701 [Piloderma croceum F 1598]